MLLASVVRSVVAGLIRFDFMASLPLWSTFACKKIATLLVHRWIQLRVVPLRLLARQKRQHFRIALIFVLYLHFSFAVSTTGKRQFFAVQ